MARVIVRFTDPACSVSARAASAGRWSSPKWRGCVRHGPARRECIPAPARTSHIFQIFESHNAARYSAWVSKGQQDYSGSRPKPASLWPEETKLSKSAVRKGYGMRDIAARRRHRGGQAGSDGALVKISRSRLTPFGWPVGSAPEREIREIATSEGSMLKLASALVDRANAVSAQDNITVVLYEH